MIPRRIGEHVKAHNWFAVSVDFLIVVVGVFVGLQVNNWNEARRDRALEARYLAGVAMDVKSDIAEIDEIARVAGVRFSALSLLLAQATGEALPDGFLSARGVIAVEPSPPFSEQQSGSADVAIFILTTLEGNRLTYETMINTGGVGLIRDGALLRDIQRYYATAQNIRDFETSVKESRLALVEAEAAAGLSPVDETPAPMLVAVFAADPALLARAKNYWLYTNRHLKLMGDLRAQAEALLQKLEPRRAP